VVQKDLEGRYTRVNQAFCEQFRIERSDVLGHTAERVVPDEAAQRHMRIDAELIKRGSGAVQYDIRQHMPDGRQVDTLVTKAVLNGPQGEPIGLVCTVVDISALKQVERDLAEAKEAAEAASAAKTVFLSTMSHEIRTPINGVLGMAELLARRSSDAEQSRMVQVILESGRGLLRVIDDVLDFSKIEAGKLLFEPEGVELECLVDGVCDALEPLAARQFVCLRPFVSPLIDHEVEVDRLRLRQILFNLVGNAIKFGAGRSGAPLEVQVRLWPEPGLIRLSVSDQGVGMDAATLGALFTPFTQADASTTRRFGGTGLGLAICKRLIEAQGGRIEVRSALGQGACFDVALPLSPRAPRIQDGPPPLDGAEVTVWGPSDTDALSHAEDLHAWLAHAGASVRRIARLDELGHATGRSPRPAVVVWAGATAAAPTGRLGDGVHLISLASQGQGLETCAGSLVSTVPRWRRRAVLQAVADALGRVGAMFADPPDSDASLPRASRPVRVLVAEDDLVNQLVIQSQLAVMGHEAVVAADGDQAWDLWREGNFGLLLTDLHMPVLDGFELARRIRAAELGQGGLDRLPIIALTASALQSEARQARLAGIDQCLTKPVQVSVLQAALQSWLPSELETGPERGLSP
jgi:PAS domain S-box-containing protein